MDNQNVETNETKLTEENVVKSETNNTDNNNIAQVKEKTKKPMSINKKLLIVLGIVIVFAVAVQVFIYFHKLAIQNYIVR